MGNPWDATAREWVKRWMCVDHKATCSRVSGSMPLPAYVSVETGCCTECKRRVALPRETLQSLEALVAAVRREERARIVARVRAGIGEWPDPIRRAMADEIEREADLAATGDEAGKGGE